MERGARAAGAPIFLIGYRGTGKTTVAREVAARLEWEWADSDDLVEQRADKSITEIFADEGEAAFRDLESQVVRDMCGRPRTVMALGGGAILREENRQAIRGAGPVVWLTAQIDTMIARMAADQATASRRPSLTKLGDRQEIETLLAQRTPYYRECATLIVDTEGKTAAEVATEIAAQL